MKKSEVVREVAFITDAKVMLIVKNGQYLFLTNLNFFLKIN